MSMGHFAREASVIPFGRLEMMVEDSHPLYSEIYGIFEKERATAPGGLIGGAVMMPRIYMPMMVGRTKCWFMLTDDVNLVFGDEVSLSQLHGERSRRGISPETLVMKTTWVSCADPFSDGFDGRYAVVYGSQSAGQTEDGRLDGES